MNGTIWIEVRAFFDSVPCDWSIFADAFGRFGCPGSLTEDDPACISGYLVSVPGSSTRADELSSELKRLGAKEVRISEVHEEDWSESFRKHFKPRRVGKHFVVRPTWESFESSPEDLVIVLDPGQAFGTGDHPTTRMCLELLEEYFDTPSPIPDIPIPPNILDLGCGSGILSIAAAKLGVTTVTGIDIEPISIEVAKQNAIQNGVDVSFLVSDGFDDRVSGIGVKVSKYDLILSNIISATLIRLAPEVAQHLNPEGAWIVSGIIEQNWQDVKSAAERNGFTIQSQTTEDGWVAAALKKVKDVAGLPPSESKSQSGHIVDE